jgi:3-oxoadipate enol-lactonase
MRSLHGLLAVLAGVAILHVRVPHRTTPPPAPPAQCKWGFLRLRCLGAGCIKHGGKCTLPTTTDEGNDEDDSAMLVVCVCLAVGLVVFCTILRAGERSEALTKDGVLLPFEIVGKQGRPVIAVVGHGLGFSDQTKQNHVGDTSRTTLAPALEAAGFRGVWYTAAGHGESGGWEDCSPDRFEWPNLAEDMCAVADAAGLRRFVAMGNSMGAATSLYAALRWPERIAALVLYRPPTLWETRVAQRKAYADKAASLKAVGKHTHTVLTGASQCDAPPRHDERSWSSLRDIPTLLLCHENDRTHPVSTGEALQSLIPRAQLHVVENLQAAEAEYPRVLEQWLRETLILSPLGPYARRPTK